VFSTYVSSQYGRVAMRYGLDRHVLMMFVQKVSASLALFAGLYLHKFRRRISVLDECNAVA
jgi:hypothetical protein